MTSGAVLIAAAVLLLVVTAPAIIDTLANRRGLADPAAVPEASRALHQRLWIADLHADSLLWSRDLCVEHWRGHVDVPRLRRGNVAFQVFTVVSKVPFGLNFEGNPATSDMLTALAVLQRWPPRTWRSLHARALYQARKLHAFAEASQGQLVIVTNATELDALSARRGRGERVVGGLLGLEGAHVLEGDVGNLESLFAAGFRLLGLTHFFDTEVAGSAHGLVKGGLTRLGRRVIARVEELGMIVDLTHASPAAIDEVTALASTPVIVSHTGVAGLRPSPRNLTDRQLDQIAATGGLVGITYFPHAVGGKSVEAIVRAIRYAADRVGAPHVALGSDFDGAVRTPFDAAGLPILTDALLAAGFGERDVAAIMGENVRRVLRATLPRG